MIHGLFLIVRLLHFGLSSLQVASNTLLNELMKDVKSDGSSLLNSFSSKELKAPSESALKPFF